MAPTGRTRDARAHEHAWLDAAPDGPDRDERRVRRCVAAARAGDPEAVRAIWEAYGELVRAHVRHIVRDDHDADDVTQQVFAKLLGAGLDRYEPADALFRSWILRVAGNAAIDHLRRSRRLELGAPGAPERPCDDAGAQARASLRLALGALPPAQRDVLVLTDLVGLSADEVAHRMGRSVRAVHGLHYRARAAARVALDELGSAPATLAS